MKRWKRWIPVLISLALLAGGTGLRIIDPDIVQGLRLLVFDSFQRLKPRAYQPVPVRIVDLDDATLERIGQWPWPRTKVAELVTRLTELGAAVIVFDMVFAEPDRTSPARVLSLWPDTPVVRHLRQQVERLPDHDQILADEIAKSRVVTGFMLTGGDLVRKPALKKGFSYGGYDPLPSVKPKYTGAVVNLPVIEAAAAGNGSINPAIDTDGVIRRMPTVLRLGDDLYPSLALAALRVAQGGKPGYQIKAAGASGVLSFGEHTGINRVKVGAFVIPTNARGEMWVHYTAPRPERFIPAWKVFESKVSRKEIDGVIVLVGTTAAGLKDQRPTPLNPVMAGVEIHAQAIEQIILGDFLERPELAPGAEILYLVVFGLFLIFLLPWVGVVWCAIIGGGATVGAFALSWYAYDQFHWLFDPVYPSAFGLLVYLVASLVSFLRTEAEKNQVRSAFGRYMSPALVEQLAENPERLQLGGEMRDMTLLFCDVRGFTSISELYKSDPQGLTSLINRFLTPTSDAIMARRGTIDKYMGDCIMAFWNAPLPDDEHASHACESALAMLDCVAELNETLKAEAEAEDKRYIPINVGIGLNSGECCVGNMGSEQRFDYSVLGDDVNLASRLEGQSKTYGVGIVIGENTYRRAEDFAVIELDLIKVRGKNEAVRIFALLGLPAMRDDPAFKALCERHAEMLVAYRGQRWQEARAMAEACRNLNGALDGLYDLYDKRISAYAADPPGPDWDGVFVATTK